MSNNCVSGGFLVLAPRLTKRPDTVGELGSAKICVSHMPSWKVKKLGKLTQEKVLLELRSRFANSIRGFNEIVV